MYKKFFVKPSLLALFFLMSACGNSEEQAKIKGLDGANPQKPGTNQSITGVAPRYSTTQFAVGHWIEWTRTFGTRKECRRLLISGASPNGVTVELRPSLDCKTWDNTYVEIYQFVPTTGEIRWYQICSEQKCVDRTPTFKTIDPLAYANDEKVQHVLAKYDSFNEEKKTYPIFYLSKEPARMYLNLPGHAFHGFALHWVDKTSTGTWSMDISRAKPAIDISSAKD
jgi:hypothetical protein